ncbi:ion transporter [Vibrio nomapromontoriensis]|uniref:ion transporter n=1 Tax=Vibrio nomapromontoriensis TaxID=2910246 RepID=UPI003D0AD805
MKIKRILKDIVETRNTKIGQLFDLLIQLLICVSITSFSLETLPSLSNESRNTLHYVEIICISIFTVEYLVRFWVADARWKFVRSFSGIVDVLAILPFYLSLGVDLRSIRIFRLFRLVRVLKLAKYSDALNRFHVAFKLAKEELTLFFSLTLALIYLASAGIYFFESKAQPEAFSSIFDSLWWAVITLTTVGYGDVYPITVGGRIFTFAILMVGLGVVSIPAGIIASALNKARQLQNLDASN